MTGSSRNRTTRVIAVFGGNHVSEQVLTCAESLGREIAARHQILLTGGTKPDGHAVKNLAIRGAGSSAWVGVDPDRPASDPYSFASPPLNGFVVHSGLKDKRNFLEGLMCDAAIVLEGGT